jgi:hypothetical protein
VSLHFPNGGKSLNTVKNGGIILSHALIRQATFLAFAT